MQQMHYLDEAILKDYIKRNGIKKAKTILKYNLKKMQQPLLWTSNDFKVGKENLTELKGLYGTLYNHANATLQTTRVIGNNALLDITPGTACTVIFHSNGNVQYSFGSSFNNIVAIKKI